MGARRPSRGLKLSRMTSAAATSREELKWRAKMIGPLLWASITDKYVDTHQPFGRSSSRGRIVAQEPGQTGHLGRQLCRDLGAALHVEAPIGHHVQQAEVQFHRAGVEGK